MTPLDAAEIVALAEKVEAATGPDDALAMEIAILDYRTPGGIGLGVNYDPDLWMDRHGSDVTASLDAAMLLLDDTWGYEQRRPSDAAPGARCYAEIWWVPAFPRRVSGKGATPALALTAAALRARSASLSDHRE